MAFAEAHYRVRTHQVLMIQDGQYPHLAPDSSSASPDPGLAGGETLQREFAACLPFGHEPHGGAAAAPRQRPTS